MFYLIFETSLIFMDTLGYAKRLRDAGVPQQQAEAHAEAARDYMGELVTKTDLQTTVQSAVQMLEAKIEAQSLRLTVRLGGLLATGIAILAGIIRLG